jgi:formylglycine-generating enzyme
MATVIVAVLSLGIAFQPARATRADVFHMPAGQTSLQFVPVGDPGNTADSTGYGAVSYPYSLGKYDVTVRQYSVFLNSVAATDTYGLWSIHMATDFPALGISRTGSSGTYAYTVKGNGNMPIFSATWGSAARFANWLQNGQPTGGEGPGTTETGAYTLNGATDGAALMAITRNLNATYFIPTEDEWYKAAYYKADGTNAGYWLYPTQSNDPPSNVLSATGTNNANFSNPNFTDPTNLLTSVGAFAASAGPYGTFDRGGDLKQWNETAVDSSSRGVRGESFNQVGSGDFQSSSRGSGDPRRNFQNVGFRVANVPEPAGVVLLAVGFAGLLLAWMLRRRANGRLEGV